MGFLSPPQILKDGDSFVKNIERTRGNVSLLVWNGQKQEGYTLRTVGLKICLPCVVEKENENKCATEKQVTSDRVQWPGHMSVGQKIPVAWVLFHLAVCWEIPVCLENTASELVARSVFLPGASPSGGTGRGRVWAPSSPQRDWGGSLWCGHSQEGIALGKWSDGSQPHFYGNETARPGSWILVGMWWPPIGSPVSPSPSWQCSVLIGQEALLDSFWALLGYIAILCPFPFKSKLDLSSHVNPHLSLSFSLSLSPSVSLFLSLFPSLSHTHTQRLQEVHGRCILWECMDLKFLL